VNFGGKKIEAPPSDDTGKPDGGPANRRAEMWSNLKSALQPLQMLRPANLLAANHK
jgi:hypothetical protein